MTFEEWINLSKWDDVQKVWFKLCWEESRKDLNYKNHTLESDNNQLKYNISILENYIEGLSRVIETHKPVDQVFSHGDRVRIKPHETGYSIYEGKTERLMSPYGDKLATVLYSYKHAFNSENMADSYCLMIDDYGSVSWFEYENLEKIK